MKRFFCIALSLFAFLHFPIEVYAYKNEPNGFDGILWGTTLSKLKNLKYIEKECDAPQCDSLYIKQDGNLTFGGEKVKDINYHFNKNVFVAASINAQGKSKWDIIKKYLISTYGQANGLVVTNNAIWDRLEWDGNLTHIWASFLRMNDSILIVIFSSKHTPPK